MKFHRAIHSFSLILFLNAYVLLADAPTKTQKPFRAGAATSNITPEIGDPLVGGFRPLPSKHVNDELHARCLFLDNGDTRMAIVVCDSLGLAQEVCDAAR